jgi:hypothetical protein
MSASTTLEVSPACSATSDKQLLWERVLGMSLLTVELGGFTVFLVGASKLTIDCHVQTGERLQSCGISYATEWIVVWLEFVITVLAMAMLFLNWLRHFKQALLSLFSIVTTLLIILAHFFTPLVYHSYDSDPAISDASLPTPQFKAAGRILLAGLLPCIICNILWIIFFNGLSCTLNPAPAKCDKDGDYVSKKVVVVAV